MKLSPFGVSFDGPLDPGARWRARLVACVLGGAILFLAFGGLPALLNASTSMLAALSNAALDIRTTGVASPDERIDADVTAGKAVLEANASVHAEAVIAASSKPRLRASSTSERDTTAPAKLRQRSQPQTRDPARTLDAAAVELRWRERAAEIERRAPRTPLFR